MEKNKVDEKIFHRKFFKKHLNELGVFLCPFNRFFKLYIYKHLKQIIFTLLLMVVVSLLTALIAYLVGPTINKVFVEKNKTLLYCVCLVLVCLYFVKTLATYIQEVCLKVLCTRVATDIHTDMLKKVVKMPMKDVDKTPSGQIVTVFLNDIINIGNASKELFVMFFRDFITVVFLIFVVFYNDWLLAMVGFCVYPFVFVPLSKVSKSVRSSFAQEQNLLQTLTAKLTDILNGIKTIKTYNTETLETNKIKTLLIQYAKTSIVFIKKTTLASPLMELGCGLSIALIIFVGGYRIINKQCDIGCFFSFFTSLIMVHRPARRLAGVRFELQSCYVSLNRVFSFIDGLQTEDLTTGLAPDMCNATIKFENVNFNYCADNNTENDDTKSTLYDVNLEIKPRSKIAFVGFSGCGKSTLISLLLKLYDCNGGKILIDGIDIKDISSSFLRRNIAYVGQDNFLFDDTIKNNILYGSKKQNTEADIQKAVQFAQINFLSNLEHGIEERVGCGGNRLSTGQKQRITIARAVVKDSPIVVFDEATSALDATTECEVRNAIFTEMKSKTVIIVAHRLSTIVGCDKIYVMENGRIVESGTHTQLLASNGLYKHLWNDLNNNSKEQK